MELTKMQEKIINAPEDKIAVEACAAALKTSTLIEKVRKLLRDGNDPSSIAVITFTRMAATELIERLGEDYKDGLFVGTIHSLGARFLSINGLGGRIKQIAEDEDFDKIFELCKGLDIAQSYDWVLVDEMQDTGEKEMEFIFDLINPEHYFVVFDTRQSIYSFKGARPDLLMKYLKGNAKFYPLNQNFRNASNILSFAQRIISRTGSTDDSICMHGPGGEVYEMEYNINTLVDFIKKNPPFSEWAVLVRTNANITKISKDLACFDIPTQTFQQGDLTKTQLEKMMKEDKVKILTVHSAKGLAFDNVAVYDLRWWNNEEVRINYVAATRARDRLLWMTTPKKKSSRNKVYEW
jgi:superfamily I DNA/RNA helicase